MDVHVVESVSEINSGAAPTIAVLDRVPALTLWDFADWPLWVTWKSEARIPGGRPTKVPYSPDGYRASSTRPKGWGTWGEAHAHKVASDAAGLGVMFCGLPDDSVLCGADLDSCRHPDGTLEPWAIEILDMLGTYAEVSPSGTGVKALFRAATYEAWIQLCKRLDGWAATWPKGNGHDPGGDHQPNCMLCTGHRFFTLTGQRLEEYPETIRGIAMDGLYSLTRALGPVPVRAQRTAAENPAVSREPVDDDELAAKLADAREADTRLTGYLRSEFRNDKDRSACAYVLGASLKGNGFSYPEMVRVMEEHPLIGDWTREKGHADGDRELLRIWDRSAVLEPRQDAADEFAHLTKDIAPASDGVTTTDERRFIISEPSIMNYARELVRHVFTIDGATILARHASQFHGWLGSCYRLGYEEDLRMKVWKFLDKVDLVHIDKKGNATLVKLSPGKAIVDNVWDALKAVVNVPMGKAPPSWLDNRTDPPADQLISFSNGLLHRPTRKMLPHTPAYFALNALPYAYDEDAPSPKRWLEFLTELWPDDPESISFLRQWFGLMLTTDIRFQKILFMIGPRRSGRGTIVRVLSAMLGDQNVCNPTLGNLGDKFGMEAMIGKLLATITDARLSDRAEKSVIAERLLMLSGGDRVEIPRKYLKAWEGYPTVRLMILSNEMPKLTDASGALPSRMIILRLVNSFFGREDINLTEKLIAELPGITNWALDGLDDLMATNPLGFVQPASAAMVVREFGDYASVMGAFVRDRCVVEGEGLKVVKRDLIAAWHRFVMEIGWHHGGTDSEFGRQLRAVVPALGEYRPRAEEGNRLEYYTGIQLDDGMPPPPPRDDEAWHCQLAEEGFRFEDHPEAAGGHPD